MKTRLALALALAASFGLAAQPYRPELSGDHIAANVPEEAVFDQLLERDLLAYMQTDESPSVVSVSWAMLRDGPTQSGVAYPKYYLWVEAAGSAGRSIKGAVRVAAVDRVRFEVTDFISASEAAADPQSVSSTFPAPLVPVILAKAAAE